MRRPAQFTAVIRGGARAGGHLAVAYARIGGAGDRKVGLVVSKAVGNSVVRHRVTRRLRAVAAELLGGLPTGTDLVIRALPAMAQADFLDLRSQVGSCVAKAVRKAQ